MKRTLSVCAAFVLIQMCCFAQTILLQVDFSSETLPTEWTNDSLGNPALYSWEFNNPGARSIVGGGFDTSFAILDSDHDGFGASQYVSLTTDTFSAAGFAALALELDEQYFTQGDSGSFRKIEASGDNGNNWMVVTIDSASTGYPVAAHHIFDLDTLAGSTGVMIRFTYSGIWDYWWAIDNIRVFGYVACTAPPVAGQAASSHAAVCSNNDFVLSLNGNTLEAGLTYQWQSSPDSMNWSDLAGDTLSEATATQSVATYYRCLVTCSGQTDSSAGVKVEMNASNLCYCMPQTPACTNINYISRVEISGTSLNNITSCDDNIFGMAYSSFPASGNTTAIVHQNSSYDFAVYSTGVNIISLWIDYDRSGSFDSTEWYRVALNSSQGIPSVVTIQIPDSATQGWTGMRIRTRAFGNTNGYGDPCTAFASGETEDYYIYIDTLLSGIPELSLSEVNVYPNPATEFVHVDFGKHQGSALNLRLFSMLGSCVRDLRVSGNSTAQINISGLAEGIYFLQISDKEGSVTKKVVVKRN
jgi:hypothetical protein